jgi:hypothetical protein
MTFSSTYTHQSIACPGVTIKLRRIGPKKRAELEIALAPVRIRHRELSARYEDARAKLNMALDAMPRDEAGVPSVTPLMDDVLILGAEFNQINAQVQSVNRAEIFPAFIAAALIGFDGISDDGKPITAEMLCEFGPDELFEETATIINGGVYVAPEQAENLLLPTTSSAPVDGTTNSTIAPSVSQPETIETATAEHVTPTT